MAVQEATSPSSISLSVRKLKGFNLLLCNVPNFMITFYICRTREEWKVHRSAHNQQIKPANIFSYAPGMNKVTNRLMKNLESSKSQQGYVENIGSFLSNWAMEGIHM